MSDTAFETLLEQARHGSRDAARRVLELTRQRALTDEEFYALRSTPAADTVVLDLLDQAFDLSYR